jgi:hypothetical protein
VVTPVPTPTRAPGVISGEREAHVDYRNKIKAGEASTIDVTLNLPATFASVEVPGEPGYQSKQVPTRRSGPIQIYFRPPQATQLTLAVGAPSFEITHVTEVTQQVTEDQDQVGWTFAIAPKAGVEGRQDLAISITQEIAGADIPRDKRTFVLENLTIVVEEAAEEGSSMLSQVGSGAKWMVPAVLIPLLTLAVGLVGRETIVGWIRRWRKDKTR